MKFKKIQIVRWLSSFVIFLSTFSFLYFYKKIQLFAFFNVEKRRYIISLIGMGVFLLLLSVYIGVKTAKQYRSNKELMDTKQKHRGIYRTVRNPIYSTVFLFTSGILFITNNYLALVLVAIHWTILTSIIIYLEEPRLIDQLDKDYIEYTLQVSRLIPWFSNQLKLKQFNKKEQVFLQDASTFLNKKITAPVMGYHFQSFVNIFSYRKGICFVTEKEVVFYSYDVFRGHYGQMIPFNKISSFIYGKNKFGYSVRFIASGTKINLRFIQKGQFDELITHSKKKIKL